MSVHVRGSLVSLATSIAVLSSGCSTSPRATGPTVEEVTAQMPFDRLQKNVLAKFKGSSVQRQRYAQAVLRMSAQDAETPLLSAPSVESEFKSWCDLHAGTWYTAADKRNAPADVTEAMRVSKYLVLSAEMKYSEERSRACVVGGNAYVVESSLDWGLMRPGQAEARSEGYRFAWFGPDELKFGAEREVSNARITAKNKELSERRRAEEAASDAARGAEVRRQRELVTARLTKSKKGASLSCQGSVLAQGMSAPISRAQLDCEGFKTDMKELTETGWRMISQTSSPDGDFGGVARTNFDMVFQKL